METKKKNYLLIGIIVFILIIIAAAAWYFTKDEPMKSTIDINHPVTDTATLRQKLDSMPKGMDDIDSLLGDAGKDECVKKAYFEAGNLRAFDECAAIGHLSEDQQVRFFEYILSASVQISDTYIEPCESTEEGVKILTGYYYSPLYHKCKPREKSYCVSPQKVQ